MSFGHIGCHTSEAFSYIGRRVCLHRFKGRLFLLTKLCYQTIESFSIIRVDHERLDDSFRATLKCCEIVPSLEDDCHLLTELPEAPCHVCIPGWRDTDLSKWITECRIEACGNNDQVRIEEFDDWEEDVFTCEDVVFVSNDFLLICTKVERELNVVPFPLARACKLLTAFRAGVEASVIVSVD